MSRSKQQMQEHVESAAGDHLLSGEAHDFLDLRPIRGGVAVNRAMFAHRLGVERAIASLNKRVQQ